MNSIYTAVAIFSMTAILGMYLISLVLNNKPTPNVVSLFHGLFAVTGIVLLIVYCNGNSAGPMTTIIVFSIAALGGLTMLVRKLNGKTIPKWLAVTHGLIAVVGFILLLVFAFGSNTPV